LRHKSQLYIVGEADAVALCAAGRHERPWRFEGLPKLRESRADWPCQLFRARRRLHPLRGTHKERIVQTRTQAANGVAERRLAETHTLGGAADMAFIQQRLESQQKIEVDAVYIQDPNSTYYVYPFQE
jgi:hypothetical protein